MWSNLVKETDFGQDIRGNHVQVNNYESNFYPSAKL